MTPLKTRGWSEHPSEAHREISVATAGIAKSHTKANATWIWT